VIDAAARRRGGGTAARLRTSQPLSAHMLAKPINFLPFQVGQFTSFLDVSFK